MYNRGGISDEFRDKDLKNFSYNYSSQVVPVVKKLPANAGDIRDTGSIPGSGRSPEGGMATHASILAWKMPWTEKLGRL